MGNPPIRACATAVLAALVLAAPREPPVAAQSTRAGAPTSDTSAIGGPQATVRVGWLTVAWGDPQSGGPGITRFVLTEDDDSRMTLRVDAAVLARAGGLAAVDRRRVAVRLPEEMGVLALGQEARALDLAVVGEFARTLTAEPRAAATGRPPWISIACKFADVAAEPKPASYFTDMYRATFPGLDHYWRELSFGALGIAGTALGWVRLPLPRASYVSEAPDLERLFADCTAAVDSMVNFADFSGIQLMFNDTLGCCAWGGGHYATLDGVLQIWPTTWQPPWGYHDLTVVSHEMGHGFGLPHSGSAFGPYTNRWDVMSDTWTDCARLQDATFGCLGQHTIGVHKDMLGWIPRARHFWATAAFPTTIAIEQLARPQSPAFLMARIPIGSTTRFYTVEARRHAGNDTKLPGQGIVIHEVDPARPEPAWIVDADHDGDSGDGAAIWTPGEVFTDAPYGISVAVVAETPTGFQVVITNGSNPPSPTISAVTPDVGPVTGNTPVTLTGTNFLPGVTTVAICGLPAPGVTVASTTSLTALTPAVAGPGSCGVEVATTAGAGTLPAAFTYYRPASVTSLTPSLASPSPAGTRVVWTATAVDGLAPLEYRFEYAPPGGGWLLLRDYAHANTVSWTPVEEGAHTVRVKVRSAGTTSGDDGVLDGLPFVVTFGVTELFVSPAPPLPLDTTATWTAATSGAPGTVEYRFWLYHAATSGWTMLRDYSTTATASWRPATAGSYTVQVWARHVGATADWEAWRSSGPFHAGPLVTSFTTSVPFPVHRGTAIRLTATAAGVTGSAQFRFLLYDQTLQRWSVLREYSASNSVEWIPNLVGRYSVQVWVRGAASTAAWDAWKGFGPFDVISAPPVISGIQADRYFPLTLGHPVVFTAAASGGTGPLRYKFYLYETATGKWSVLRDYATSSTASWTPPRTGRYSMQVWVRNAGSSAAWDAWRSLGPFDVYATPPTVRSLTADRGFPVKTGTKVTFTASASGGIAPLEYRFWLHEAARDTWMALRDYSTSATIAWVPAAAGTYALQVWVRSAGSNAPHEAWRSLAPIEVEPGPPVLISVVADTPSPVPTGTPITWTATAFGGNAPLHYRFWIYDHGAGAWTMLQDYGPSNRAIWAPARAGLYHVQVWVRSASSSASWEAWLNGQNIVVQ